MKRNGQQVRGELIAVRHNSILLSEYQSADELSIDITDIKVVKIPKRSFFGTIFIGVDSASAGLSTTRYKSIQIEGKSPDEIDKVLQKLRKKARVPDYQ